MSTKTSNTKTRAPRQEARLIDLNRVIVEQDFQVNGKSLGKFNTREDFGDLEELGVSLKTTFENNPFDCPPLRGHFKGKDFILTDGERRFRAAKQAGMTEYPILPFSSDPLKRMAAQAELNSGKVFNDYERAVLARRLRDAYLLQNPDAKDSEVRDEVMSLMGISQATAYNYEKILDAPKEAVEMVKSGVLSGTTLRKVMAKNKAPKDIVAVCKELVQEAEREMKAQNRTSTSDTKTSGKKEKAKATSKTLEKVAAKKTPFVEKPFNEKFEAVLQKVANSDSPGARLLLALNNALKGQEKELNEIVALVNEAKFTANSKKAEKKS